MENTLEFVTNDMPEDRKAVFERVWRRVMNSGATEEVPVEEPVPGTTAEAAARPMPGTAPEAAAAPVPGTAPEAAMAPMPGTAAEVETAQETETVMVPAVPQDHPQGDFPTAVGVLGPECLDCAGLLQGLIRRKLTDWRTYQALARRVAGQPGRVFAGLANDARRQAKELCAAYFLISGVRYWPDPGQVRVNGSYLDILRRRFRQEQETMAAYLAGAEVTRDPCLREMFQKHAKEAWGCAEKVRTLVEQA